MLIRSPRRFAILTFIAFIFIFIVLQQSPWAHQKVYEQLPLFDLGIRPQDQSTIPFDGQQNDAGGKPSEVPVASGTAINSSLPWVTGPSRSQPYVPPTPRPSNMKEYMKKMLKWSRPSWDGHWPPFKDYINKAYDPNRWEQFEM